MELEQRKTHRSGSSTSSKTPNEQQTRLLDDIQDSSPVTVPFDDPGFDLRYKVDDVPPWYLCIFLGFQHYLTMFGATASIPLVIAPALCIAKDSVAVSEILSTLFFVSGLITVLQATVGVRLPVIQGGTFAFLAPAFSILSLPQWKCPATPESPSNSSLETVTSVWDNTTSNMTGLTEDEIWQPRMREVQGAIITASIFQVVIGGTGVMGLIMQYIGPLTICPTIALIGIALFQVAADTCAQQWGIAIFTIILIALFSQYLRNVEIPVYTAFKPQNGGCGCTKRTTYPIFKMFPVILSILVAWMLCGILTGTGAIRDDPDAIGYLARTDLKTAVLYKASWFRIPYPFQWGIPTFNLAATLGMLAGVVAGMLESVGDYYACARLSGAPPPPTHAINRGIMIEGIGCVLSGMWGSGTGTTSYSENIGAIGITKVGSRRVIQTAGAIMTILGMFAKFGALFVTIPDPIVGGVFMVMFGMITAVGVSNLQYVDLNSTRNLFVFGFSVLFGLSVPDWLSKNEGIINTGVDVLDQVITVLLSTSMFLGGIIAFFLDNTIPGTPEERGIIKWRSELVEPDSSDSPVSTCYELPLISKHIHQATWTRYIPICPSFKGLCKCSCPHSCHKNFNTSADPENGNIPKETYRYNAERVLSD